MKEITKEYNRAREVWCIRKDRQLSCCGFAGSHSKPCLERRAQRWTQSKGSSNDRTTSSLCAVTAGAQVSLCTLFPGVRVLPYHVVFRVMAEKVFMLMNKLQALVSSAVAADVPVMICLAGGLENAGLGRVS